MEHLSASAYLVSVAVLRVLAPDLRKADLTG